MSVSAIAVTDCVTQAVSDGYIDERDAADFAGWLARYLARWGVIADADVQRVAAVSRADEQRRIVEQYAVFARTTAAPRARADKLAALGVSSSTMTHWARKHFGPGYLAEAMPPTSGYLIASYLRRHPGASRKEIALHSGVKRTSIPGALAYGLRRGKLVRQYRDGLWRWYCV